MYVNLLAEVEAAVKAKLEKDAAANETPDYAAGLLAPAVSVSPASCAYVTLYKHMYHALLHNIRFMAAVPHFIYSLI